MTRNIFSVISIVAAALIAATAAYAQGPAHDHDDLIAFYDDVRGGICSQTDSNVGLIATNTPANTLLFNRTFRGQPNPQFCDPILNPNGSQMTLGQYNAVSGRSEVRCTRDGSRSEFEFDRLRPNGVYTIWIVLGVFPGQPSGVGGLGRTAMMENSFVASRSGHGRIERTTPEEDLSIFGHVGPCVLDGPVVFELVYHSDGMSHGGDPGPPNTWVTNARFLYP